MLTTVPPEESVLGVTPVIVGAVDGGWGQQAPTSK
jgi:hypothetical protein